MKRSRDDVFTQPQPIVLEPSGRPQITCGGKHKVTTGDAVAYLKDVKDTFHDDWVTYEKFRDIMRDFLAQRVTCTRVVEMVKELFKGHRKLLLGLNMFLPKEVEIVLPEDDEPQVKKGVGFKDALQFVQKVETRLQGDDHVYKSFLEILKMYKKGTKSIPEVHQEVVSLLHNHTDLINEFTNFVPDTLAAAANRKVHSSRTHKDIACHDDRHSASHDFLADTADPHHDNGHKIHGKKEKARREDRVQHSQDKDFDNHATNKASRKHKSANNTLEDTVTELFHQDMREQVISLREKVKERLQNSEIYHAFLKCIRHYCTENITRPELQSLVNDLLGAYPDLMEEVSEFIDQSEKNSSLRSESSEEDQDHDNEEEDRCRKINDSKNASGFKPSSLPSNDEYLAKPIHELDLSDCKQCTPSYRLLPKNYPIPSASQRTKIGAEVLNDHWVSVTSGSEDYSFKHMRKNQYEESLFRCEDDRFELDMLLESVNVTIRRVELLLDKINNNSIRTDCVVRVEDHLTALNLRCIERLYGYNRLDVMGVLKKSAPLALPVILTRLKQKEEEWARCRFGFNKIWAETYAKNYHKSLDHRSFYFKQQDSKSLSAKALLVEIKEISEEKTKEENIYETFVSGKRHDSTPHQEFEYCDLDVHADIYQLMKHYIPQNCSIEQFDKFMKVWTTFVEPMFNVPIRPRLIAKNGRQIEGENVHKEREEGEVSPNGDFEDNFASFGANGTKEIYQNGYHENALENEADDEGEEESAHRSSSDSLGSDTANVEDRSPEEHDGVHDKNAEIEGEAERFLETVRPVAKYAPTVSHNDENDSRVFYGNDAFYVFFRLHQILYSRLKEAKENSANAKWRGLNDTRPNDSYARFLDLLYTFLGGDADSAKYEDECRTILGNWSFPLFTLDKLIYKLSKQLLAIAMDEVDNMLLHLYTYEHMRKPGRYVDELYYANARVIANDDNIYRFESSVISKTISQTRLTIRLMDPECDMSEAPSVSIDQNFEAYPTNELVPVVPGKKKVPLFLKRNKRRYTCEDEDLALMQAMEEVQISNRIECKINCITYKITYVLDTEDFMVRKGRKKVNSQRRPSNGYSHKVQKFHKMLQSRISSIPT